jgi:hypothetical protein
VIPVKESGPLFAGRIRISGPIAEPSPLPKGTACEAPRHARRSTKHWPADLTLTSGAVNYSQPHSPSYEFKLHVASQPTPTLV